MTFMGLSSFHALIDKSALRKDIIISWYNSIFYISLLPDANIILPDDEIKRLCEESYNLICVKK